MAELNIEEKEIEAILVIQSNEQELYDELKSLFPDEDDITIAKRAVGGAEIKGWFILGKGILGKILDFISRRGDRITGATVIIGSSEIKLVGFGKEDVMELLESPGMQNAITAYSQNQENAEN
jgi:hypothetical protein